MDKKGRLFIITGLLFLAAALALTLYNIYDSKRAQKASEKVLSDLIEEITIEGEQLEELEGLDMADALVDSNREMPVVEIDGDYYIGILEIPKIDLSLPVMGEWNYKSLKTAPCRYSGSVYQDNMIVAGHNYASHFRPIKNLPEGTEIIFTDGEDRQFQYEIGWVEVLDGTAVDEMLEGEWDLTLFTCTYGGKARYAVRCIKK